MADFSSSGLWVSNKQYIAGGGMVDYEETNLPKEICKELDDWIFDYEDLWYSHYSSIIEKVPKFNFWGRQIALKIKDFYKDSVEVWYCSQDEDYNNNKYSEERFCVITRKADDVTLGCSLIKTVEVLGIEQIYYYPVIGATPDIGTKFIPKESKDKPGCLEWDYAEFVKEFPELC